jgi:predicted RNA-binding Zn ribbon-like protein
LEAKVIDTDIHEEKFKDLLGESLCLDFVNTVSWRGRHNSKDFFDTYTDLLNWSRYVNILKAKDFGTLNQRAKKNPDEAKKVLKRAIVLREAMYDLFSARSEGTTLPKNALAIFNNFLSKTMSHSQIVQKDKGFMWNTDGDKNSLDWMLNPVIQSAAELLISVDIGKVKLCGDNECGWIFLDSSRNQSRRWCDMKDCGNRAKARRFYRKKKSGQ